MDAHAVARFLDVARVFGTRLPYQHVIAPRLHPFAGGLLEFEGREIQALRFEELARDGARRIGWDIGARPVLGQHVAEARHPPDCGI